MAFVSKLPQQEISIFSIMSALAREENAINLSQGFPNFDCSPELIELVNRHMKAGNNQYAPMPGVPVLREIIAHKIKQLYQVNIDPNQEITITAGATQAIYNSIQAVVHPGDEVIIIEPAYDSYVPSIKMCGGIVVPYALHAPDFKNRLGSVWQFNQRPHTLGHHQYAAQPDSDSIDNTRFTDTQ